MSKVYEINNVHTMYFKCGSGIYWIISVFSPTLVRALVLLHNVTDLQTACPHLVEPTAKLTTTW
jgi:hypothetical protein